MLCVCVCVMLLLFAAAPAPPPLIVPIRKLFAMKLFITKYLPEVKHFKCTATHDILHNILAQLYTCVCLFIRIRSNSRRHLCILLGIGEPLKQVDLTSIAMAAQRTP